MAKPRPRRHYTSSSPAPLGGLNVRDGLNIMQQTDAVALVNWIPQQYGVRLRKGWTRQSIGFGAPVRTIMAYQPDREITAEHKLFAVTDGNIWDSTTPTDTPASVFTLTGDPNYGYMSSVMFSNIAGNFLLACSHQGGYHIYDGTSWTKPVAGTGVGEINGIDPNDLVTVTSWKRRLWFCERESTTVWYMDTDSITGDITAFDVGPFMKSGGKIAFIANWTIDAGEGIDDLLVIAGENGDVLIYKGTNPDSASTFALVGVYQVGRLPIGRRGFTDYGGDLLILSDRGIQPMSYVTRGGQSLLRASSIDYLSKIQPRISDLVSQFSQFRGWTMRVFPRENLLIVTVPVEVNGTFQQYALYTNTNTWTLLQGIPSNGSGAILNNDIFMGTDDGEVIEGFSGFLDDVAYGATEGFGIQGVIQPAYSYFNMPGMNKSFSMVRPSFLSVVRPAFSAQMVTDYRYTAPTAPAAFANDGDSLWDVGVWDSSMWGGELNVYDDWRGVGAIGYAGSLVISTNCVGDTFLASIDYMYEPGGVL